MRQLLLPCEDETVEFRSYFPLFVEMVEVVLHSANVRVNEVRLLSHGALRHHSNDCLRQRPSVGGYSSQFARTLLRLCFAKLLVLLVGGPDNATACAPYGARPVASGNLTTSSQVHLVAAHLASALKSTAVFRFSEKHAMSLISLQISYLYRVIPKYKFDIAGFYQM